MQPVLRVAAVASTFAALLACGPGKQDQSESAPAAEATPATPARTEVVKQAVPTVCDNLTPPPSAQFPPGFDYPQTPATINSWITPGGGHRVRFHAYCVFAGLNRGAGPSSNPTWRTWGTSTQAFPFQYNPWKPSLGAEATAQPRPSSLNAKNMANAKVGGVEAINNPAPIYGVNSAIVNNPAYRSCLQAIPNTNPQLYSLKDGTNFESNGDIMVAAVSYNQSALNNILLTKLYDASYLNSKLPAKTSPSTSISPFPTTSIVLKVMQWPVAGGGPTWSSVTALPIWDWENNPPGSQADGKYAGYEMQNLWTRAAAISSSLPAKSGQQRVEYLYGVLDPNGKPMGPNIYNDGQVVGLDRFYYRKYSQTDLNALSNCDRAILDASAYWTYKRAFQEGDSLVTIAMHIMTKEPQGDWTFQSAWWHPDALACSNPQSGNQNRFCDHRPASVPGGDTTYKNYMMTTTYGTTQGQGQTNYFAPPSTKGPIWPVAYNPYIELAASHPITTNCMNCHHRAAWPPLNPAQKPDAGRSSTYLQTSPANPNPLEVFQSSNGIFNGLTMVDSMWAVSDRAGYAVGAEGAKPEAEKKP
ncbi:MAG TPA: hypothetical protein VN851_28600 [Thermoanaerobaculia bacterium]|nr:hypothetical protein [Thermoanaerobaculia bacterium]